MINTIYLLKNRVNDKLYVGQTWRTTYDRWNYGNGYNGCTKLERAFAKYGKDNFYYEPLTFCGTQASADYWEKYFIEKYNSVEAGYNVSLGSKGSMLGRKHSPEAKMKISLANTGNKMTEENKRKMDRSGKSHPNYGQHHPCSKLTEVQVIEIKKIFEANTSGITKKVKLKQLAALFNISVSTLKAIKQNKVWKHLENL